MIIHALIRDTEEMFDAERRFDTQFPDETRLGPVQVDEGKDGSLWVAAEVADKDEATPLFEELEATAWHKQAEDQALAAYIAISGGDLVEGAQALQKCAHSITAAASRSGGVR